jgi:hypothetical protein
MRMSILAFCEWLENTAWSPALRDSIWTYPIVESIHVLALCLFLGFAVLLDLRLIGVALRRTAVSEVAGRLLPWTFAGFVLMVVSGVLLFYSDPVKFYGNVFFRAKVIMLLLAGVNAGVFHAVAYRRVADWDVAAVTPRAAQIAGGVSLALWSGIVVTGRLIAYNWFK